jgi:hypothetical protein
MDRKPTRFGIPMGFFHKDGTVDRAYVLIDAQGRIAAQEYSLENVAKKLETLKPPAGK